MKDNPMTHPILERARNNVKFCDEFQFSKDPIVAAGQVGGLLMVLKERCKEIEALVRALEVQGKALEMIEVIRDSHPLAYEPYLYAKTISREALARVQKIMGEVSGED